MGEESWTGGAAQTVWEKETGHAGSLLLSSLGSEVVVVAIGLRMIGRVKEQGNKNDREDEKVKTEKKGKLQGK